VVAALFAPDTILVSRSPGETRYALLAGEELIEVRHVRDAEIQPGAIYVGRAGAKLPSGKAIFVEFGDVLPGVLPIKDLPPQGTALAVEVVVPARGDKGAELKASAEKIPHDAKGPALLRAAPEPVQTWVSCYGNGITRVVAAPRTEAARLVKLLGVAVEDSSEDPFAAFGVDAAVETALSPHVPLPCGGGLIIEATAAVTIDVNSGPADPGVANMEALTAAASALRLRNIAGHILIDIIPTRRRTVLPRHLAEALDADPVPSRVAGVTPLGMIEMTRQRLGLSLAETLCEADGRVRAATVAYRALRTAVRHAHTAKAATVQIAAAPDVIALLQEGLRRALNEAEEAVKGEIALVVRADFERARVEVA
jgi:Ribonuclease G/E